MCADLLGGILSVLIHTWTHKHMELLKVLRAHGLPASSLHLVAGAITVAKLLYEAPASWEYVSAVDRARIEKVLERMRRTEYLPEEYASDSEKVFKADMTLLRAVLNCQNHILRCTFPPVVIRSHDLRPPPHDFQFPPPP